jgi:uncharacterized protein YkwD
MKRKKDKERTRKSVVLVVAGLIVLSSIGSSIYADLKIRKNRKVVPTESHVAPSTPTPTLTLKPTVTVLKPMATSKPKASKNLPVLNGGNIFSLINQHRSSLDLAFLSVSGELCGIAEARADLMMANEMKAFKESGTGSHFGLGGVSYSGEGVGENLAANVARNVDVLTIWKNSPPHNDLMLWTSKNGIPITKGCVATRVSEVGSIVVLLVGDK